MRRVVRVAGFAGLGFLMAGAVQSSDFKEVHRTLTLDPDGRLEIHTYKGSITVKTSAAAEVQISARIEPDGDDRWDREKVEETQIRISGGGHSVEVKSDYDEVRHHRFLGLFGGDGGSLPFVHYTVVMPGTARLEIEDYKSETKISDLKGDLKLHTYKGSVSARGLEGAAQIKTYKGDIHVDFTRFVRASRFETYKGTFDVALPRDSRFDLDADMGHRGDLESDFAIAVRTRRSGRQAMRGAVNGGGPELRFSAYRGSLHLRSL